jgi:hypothetical protein
MQGKNSAFAYLSLTLINIGFTFLLIKILADGLLEYTSGFYLLFPLIVGLATTIIYVSYFQLREHLSKMLGRMHLFVLLSFIFINMLLSCINLIFWIDLFDGRTNMLLP